MKNLLIIATLFCFPMLVASADAQVASVKDSLGGAPVPSGD